jgi:hypothetical protein
MSLFIDATQPNTVVSAVSFGEPKVNKSGGKNVALFDKNRRAIFTFVTPETDTYGVNTNQFDEGKPPTYDMTLQLNRTEKCMIFTQNMLDMERVILDEALKNSKKWFGKQLSKEVLQEFWTPFVKFPKNKETGEVDPSKSPTLRLKFGYYDGEFKNIEVYNTSSELIYPKANVDLPGLIPKGSEVKCLVRLNGIWFAGGKFGLTGKPIQIIVRPKTRLMPGVCQMSMAMSTSNEDDDEMPENGPTETTETSTMNVTVADSDEEDEDPDSEYSKAATPDSVVESGAAEVSSVETPTAPVKRRTRVVKGKDGN